MKKIFVLPLILTSTVALAEYQFQVGGSQTSTDFDGPFEASQTSLSLEAYVKTIDNGAAPFAESGFLSKQSSLFFTYNFGDFETGFGEDDDSKGYNVGSRIVSENNLFFGFELGRETTEYGDTFGIESESDQIILSIGQYISDTTAIRFSYARYDYEESDRFGSSFSSDANDLQIDVKSVTPTTNNGYISTAGFIGKTDDEGLDLWNLGFSSTYYPNQQLGIHFGFSLTDSDFIDSTVFTMGTSYFFTEQVALQFNITRQNTEIFSFESDSDSFTMSIAARF